eukprot:11215559-Lingulodinium_polyedra.AAC.1
MDFLKTTKKGVSSNAYVDVLPYFSDVKAPKLHDVVSCGNSACWMALSPILFIPVGRAATVC